MSDFDPVRFSGIVLHHLAPETGAEFSSDVSGAEVTIPYDEWVRMGRPGEIAVTCHKP